MRKELQSRSPRRKKTRVVEALARALSPGRSRSKKDSEQPQNNPEGVETDADTGQPDFGSAVLHTETDGASTHGGATFSSASDVEALAAALSQLSEQVTPRRPC